MISASLALLAASFASPVLANPALLPSGVYQAPDGMVLLESVASSFTVTDPTLPGVQIQASTSGQCALVMAGASIPCAAQVAAGSAVITIPSMGTTIPLSYVGSVAEVIAAQQAAATQQATGGGSHGGSSTGAGEVEVPTVLYDGMGNMDGTVTISDGGMSYDY